MLTKKHQSFIFLKQFTNAVSSFSDWISLMKNRSRVAEELKNEPVLFPTLHNSLQKPTTTLESEPVNLF